jgi:hypothetical protein
MNAPPVEFDGELAALLAEFVTPRRGAGGRLVYPLDELAACAFDRWVRRQAGRSARGASRPGEVRP